MTRVLVEANVLAFVLVDLESRTVDEVIVMGGVADNVAVGQTVLWEDASSDEDILSEEIEQKARSVAYDLLSDRTPWRLEEQ